MIVTGSLIVSGNTIYNYGDVHNYESAYGLETYTITSSFIALAKPSQSMVIITGSTFMSSSGTKSSESCTPLTIESMTSESVTFKINSSSAVGSGHNIVRFEDIPTSSLGLTTGSLWLSGSISDSSITSKFLMVVNP